MTPQVLEDEAARSSRRWWWVGGAVLACVAVVAVVSRRPMEPAMDRNSVRTTVDDAIDKALDDFRSEPAQGVVVYETIRSPVVLVRTDRTRGTRTAEGLGTGVIVNGDGDILTAFHVIDGGTGLRVSFADGTESPASVKSSDPDNDVAVLSAEQLPEVVVPAVLGGGARIGDEVFVVGHPLGLVSSLSAGVISGFDREMPRPNGGILQGLIQYDAAVNPGSSGGPLLDRNGHVIGIVTSLADPSGEGRFAGVGFAVPILRAGGAAGAPSR